MNKLNINYKLVDTAEQITAVVFSAIKRDRQALISKKLMGYDQRIEQVVFIEKNRVQTMGNELCINGSLAGAYLCNSDVIEISGLNKPVKFIKQEKFVTGRFPVDILKNKIGTTIQLSGIVYTVSNNKKLASKVFLKKLANIYGEPASGIIFYKENVIKFLIYVKNTDSLVWENACGSGSLAYSLFSGYTKIKQPSGFYIDVKKMKKYFAIKSPVSVIK